MKVNYLCSGTMLNGLEVNGKKLTTPEMINHLNQGEYQFVIYDAFDDVYNRKDLVMFELEHIEDFIGLDKIFVMGHFNNIHKEILKISDDILEDLLGIQAPM